jgi:putative membrane protein
LGRIPWAATSGLHFVNAVVAADNYRAAAGGLAVKKSPSPDVRDFGRMLWEDSIENWRNLKWVLTKSEPEVVLPTYVFTRDMFLIDQLVPVSGDAFDRRFIAQQTASLKEALALAEGYARAGDDLDLKEFAAKNVPKIKMQLDRILEVEIRHQRLASR